VLKKGISPVFNHHKLRAFILELAMNNYESLIQELDRFIRKYYLSQLLKGSLLLVGSLLSIYLLLSVSEFAFYFSSWMRWTLILGFSAGAFAAMFFWIWKPLSGFSRLGNHLSYEQAAVIIGRHFSEVEDRLLNILQLRSEQTAAGSPDLVEASIRQKMNAISWVPFSSAVDFKENRQYLRYALPPVVLLLVLLIAAPNVLKESNARLVQPAKTFSKPAPFDFLVDRKALNAIQFSDFDITVRVKGKTLPAELEWLQGTQPIPMVKKDANTFEFKVPNVQEDFSFRLRGSGFLSEVFRVKVLKKPLISSMKISLIYPSHTGRKTETLQNTGDLVVPVGTSLKWELRGNNTDEMQVRFESGNIESIPTSGKKLFSFSKRVLKDTQYKLYVSNKDVPRGDSILFNISTIPDRHPSIVAEAIADSLDSRYIYFLGNASDDYGLSRLEFHTRILNEKGQIKASQKNNIGIQKLPIIDFTHQFNIRSMNLQPGDRLEYFFEIWDNDGVTGPKSARSATFTFTRPTTDEFRKMENVNNDQIKNSLGAASKEVKQLSKDIKQLRDKILTKKNLNWEDKKETEELLKKHEQLSKELESIQEQYKENLQNQQEFKQVDPDILEKQELLSKMMDELLSQEMKELMKELEELLDKFLQNNAFEKLENMQMSNDQLNKELDKMLELFKRLELEQKASDISNQLEELAKKQEALEEKTKSGNTPPEQGSKEQDVLNKAFDEIAQEMKKLEELNQDQKKPLQMDGLQEKQESIQKDMQNAKEQLQQNQPQKAGQQQQKAKNKMQEMAQSLKSQMTQMQAAQHAEDINTIRRLLDNLLKLSTEQEELLLAVKKTQADDPKYTEIVRRQYKLRDDALLIEDSLTALGKRVFQLQTFIADEVYKMKRDLKKSIEQLEARQRGPGSAAQQYVMTSANNLAVMLSEVMDQMQQQMNSMGGSCDKPKSGGKSSMPSPGDLKKLQEQLGEDLKKMGQPMKPGQDGKGMSKELAGMAQRQAAVREALRKMKEGMSQQQKKELGIDEMIDKMDKNETDIVNRRITAETLKRQKEIETRMLELENAMREQDEKDERQGKTAEELPKNPPARIEEYLRKKQSAKDMYKPIPPDLKPFYKNLVDKYFDNNLQR
jgi:hypothetical protein